MTGMPQNVLGTYNASKAMGIFGKQMPFTGSRTAEKPSGSSISQIRRAMKKGSEAAAGPSSGSVIESMKLYSQSLKKQRARSNDTALAKRKLRYSFKNISSKIISSKTSISARQVVGQAKREIQKLKDAKRTGKYDSDEIDAAIDHAKAMERIARKKVKHLEEEEMAKRCSKEDGAAPEGTDVAETEGGKDPVRKELNELRDEVGEIAKKAEGKEYIETDEVTNEMLEDITKGMEEMLDEIEELCDLMDELISSPKDMDPGDIKMLKIKHRNKEMKEITKANAEYLKAVFDRYEKERSLQASMNASSLPGQSGSGGISAAFCPEAPATAIDVAL